MNIIIIMKSNMFVNALFGATRIPQRAVEAKCVPFYIRTRRVWVPTPRTPYCVLATYPRHESFFEGSPLLIEARRVDPPQTDDQGCNGFPSLQGHMN